MDPQEFLNMAFTTLSAVGAYYARKAHNTETDLAVLKASVESAQRSNDQRHNETLAVMKEMRDDVRDVRVSVGQLLARG
jgi:selenocysteine lyase/cysteine desulfurase